MNTHKMPRIFSGFSLAIGIVLAVSVQAQQVTVDSVTGARVPVALAPGFYTVQPIDGGWQYTEGSGFACYSSVIINDVVEVTGGGGSDYPTPAQCIADSHPEEFSVCAGDTVSFGIVDFPLDDNSGTLTLQISRTSSDVPVACVKPGPLVGPVEPGVGVECRVYDNPFASGNTLETSCWEGQGSELGTAAALAELSTATVKVGSEATNNVNSTTARAAIVDLITITGGFDESGVASGTFELEIDGLMDDSGMGNQSAANFLSTIWYPSQPAPSCLDDTGACGFINGPYDFAEVYFDLLGGELNADISTGGDGTGEILNVTATDLQARLSVPWTVTEDNPAFFVAVYGFAGIPSNTTGTADFYNTAKASFTGPTGFQYSGKNGLGSELPNSRPPDAAVDLSGRVQLGDGTDLCAMVLASGEYTFTCDPNGVYSLKNLPREPNGAVIRQVYVDGTFPSVESVRGTVNEVVVQKIAGVCPDYNPVSNPGVFPGSAGKRISISGRVLDRDTETPVCAMVLANGAYVFSCDGSGSYSLEFPLDANGQYQLQVYADGFAPTIRTLDEMSSGGDVRIARASECQ